MANQELLKEIGKRISRERRERGITQEQLAERMDVSVQMISNLEGGKKAIRPENLVKLCESLEVSSDYILRGLSSGVESSVLAERISSLSGEKIRIIEKLIDSWQEK